MLAWQSHLWLLHLLSSMVLVQKLLIPIFTLPLLASASSVYFGLLEPKNKRHIYIRSKMQGKKSNMGSAYVCKVCRDKDKGR